MALNKLIPAEELPSIRKILIIQYKPFGDVLLNTGYFPALRDRFPEAQIDYLIQKPYVTLLENNPYLDNLVIMNKYKSGTVRYIIDRYHLIRRIRQEKYDAVIDQARGPGASQITLFSGARFRMGWHKSKHLSWLKGYNWVYNYRTIKNDDIYSSRAKFEMLRPLGIDEIPHNTYYCILPESRETIQNWLKKENILGNRIAVFSPVTPIRSRQWDLKLFAEVADKIREKHKFDIVLLWGPGEKSKVDYMASMMKHKPLIAPETSFNEAGALVESATVYLGNNGGVHHLAVAVGTPTLTVFGPNTSPLKWTAWHLPIHKFVKNPNLLEYVDGTFAVSPEMVLEKFDELLINIR